MPSRVQTWESHRWGVFGCYRRWPVDTDVQFSHVNCTPFNQVIKPNSWFRQQFSFHRKLLERVSHVAFRDMVETSAQTMRLKPIQQTLSSKTYTVRCSSELYGAGCRNGKQHGKLATEQRSCSRGLNRVQDHIPNSYFWDAELHDPPRAG